jgi:hypothetical protein
MRLPWTVAGLVLIAARITGAVIVPNASFEESSGKGPAGWTFTGTSNASAGAWTSDQPFAGNHALRIDAHYGSQQWESDGIRLRPAQKYLLQWRARFKGEKAWRFRSDFCGAEILFKDKLGNVLDSVRQHTLCWSTAGWQPAWFLFSTPGRTHTINIRFAIQTTLPLPGQFDVDDVELDEWPPRVSHKKSNFCLLALKVENERGVPTGARIRIENLKGEPVRPPGAIAYDQTTGAFHPLEEGTCYALIERGTYSIVVTKGFEYEPCEREIRVTKTHQDFTIKLHRLWDWRKRGWFAGDHHTHLYRHGGSLFPSLGWPDVMRVARCEGLDFLPFMGADRYPAESRPLVFSHKDFAYELTDEITEDFWGHVCPIGTTAESRRDQRYDKGPMNFDRYSAIASSGGVLSYGHPHGPLGDGDGLDAVAKTGMGHVAREFPIDLALGIPVAIDLLAMEGPTNQLGRKMSDLYRLWNLGFRPAVAASTDFHVDQGRQPIGAVRTYIKAKRLDMQAIAQGYRGGHTFATSGPLLDLRVAGAGPGDDVRPERPGQSLQVEVEAVSIGKLDSLEVLLNGKVFQTFTSAQPHRITGACRVTADRSLWIAARLYGKEDKHLASQLEGRPLGAAQFAHTSPVYVLVEDKPIFAAKAADAEYFVNWCDAVRAAWTGTESVVDERLGRARKVFAELAARIP